MITKKQMLIVSLTVCALALVALGAGQKAVDRPFKIDGNLTLTIDARTCANSVCTGSSEDWGEATHIGRYSNRAEVLSYNTVTGMITGSGTLTAANGDQLFWERNDHVFTFTGGTGRFEEAEGGFEITHPAAVPDYSQYPPLVISTHTYRGVGRITY